MSRKKSKDTAGKAIRRFQLECRGEGLGLECALAQLALHALAMEAAHSRDSWQGTMSRFWAIRNEAKNVRHALQLEYPDLDWSEHEQQGKKEPHPKAPPTGKRSAANREEDRPAPRAVWSDGDGAQQEATEPATMSVVNQTEHQK